MTATPAERARAYRARRRETTVAESVTLPIILAELVEVIHELRDSVDNLGRRDVTVPPRDVTPRHAPSTDAPAYAPAESDAHTPPTAARVGVPTGRDAVTALTVAALHGRILELLDRDPASVAALADALSIGQRATLEALVELSGLGLVHRIPGATAKDRDRWERLASPLVEALELGLEAAHA